MTFSLPLRFAAAAAAAAGGAPPELGGCPPPPEEEEEARRDPWERLERMEEEAEAEETDAVGSSLEEKYRTNKNDTLAKFVLRAPVRSASWPPPPRCSRSPRSGALKDKGDTPIKKNMGTTKWTNYASQGSHSPVMSEAFLSLAR